MRLTIVRMISSSSLAVFSQSSAIASAARPSAVRPVRSLTTGEPASPASVQAQPGKAAGSLPGVVPGRIMPRGSLLDLSV